MFAVCLIGKVCLKYVVPVKTVYTTTSGAQVNVNGVDMLELQIEVVQGMDHTR